MFYYYCPAGPHPQEGFVRRFFFPSQVFTNTVGPSENFEQNAFSPLSGSSASVRAHTRSSEGKPVQHGRPSRRRGDRCAINRTVRGRQTLTVQAVGVLATDFTIVFLQKKKTILSCRMRGSKFQNVRLYNATTHSPRFTRGVRSRNFYGVQKRSPTVNIRQKMSR